MHPGILMYHIEQDKKNYTHNSKTYYYIAPRKISQNSK
jgi:hypothetical protein